MQVGKIPGKRLEEIILKKIGYRRKEVLVHTAIGEDSAVVDLDHELLVISSDPITGASKKNGQLAIQVACNDLAAMGAEPVGVQVVLLLPVTTTDRLLGELMEELESAAASINIEILGGHTEILTAVKQPIIVVTAVGKVARDCYLTSAGAQPGDDLVVTKGLGIEGTYILASDHEELLLSKGVSPETIKVAQEYGEKISVIKEGLLAARSGANAMHDITEGGLYLALEELVNASGQGFNLYLDELPVLKETAEITEALGIDPAGLISSGSLLISIPESQDLLRKLEENGITATRIGEVISKGKFVFENGSKEEFHSPEKDELWRLMELI
jgi:hydrogenase expression/formation protein HypE